MREVELRWLDYAWEVVNCPVTHVAECEAAGAARPQPGGVDGNELRWPCHLGRAYEAGRGILCLAHAHREPTPRMEERDEHIRRSNRELIAGARRWRERGSGVGNARGESARLHLAGRNGTDAVGRSRSVWVPEAVAAIRERIGSAVPGPKRADQDKSTPAVGGQPGSRAAHGGEPRSGSRYPPADRDVLNRTKTLMRTDIVRRAQAQNYEELLQPGKPMLRLLQGLGADRCRAVADMSWSAPPQIRAEANGYMRRLPKSHIWFRGICAYAVAAGHVRWAASRPTRQRDQRGDPGNAPLDIPIDAPDSHKTEAIEEPKLPENVKDGQPVCDV